MFGSVSWWPLPHVKQDTDNPSQRGNLTCLKQRSLKRPLVMADSLYLKVPGCQNKIISFSFAGLAKSQVHSTNPCFLFSLFFFLTFPWAGINNSCTHVAVMGCDSAVSVPDLSQSRHAGTHDVPTPCHLTGLQVAEMCISSMSFNNWGTEAVKYQTLPTHPLLCQIKP